tara:strand:+ start:560 stop:1285 length:726 start_codon:yes stop_codon:yes gene_type:complete
MKHKRISSNKLASNLISVEKNRQPDMTELMLNDIDQYGESLTKTSTFRLMPLTGQYFVTGKTDRNPWGTVQLSWDAKVRLCKLTGGKVITKTVNGKTSKMLAGGAFSDQDFRRCFDYIKGCGEWVVIPRTHKLSGAHKDDPDTTQYALFVVDTNKVNNATRDGARWDSLHVNVTRGPGTRKQSTKISIKHPTLDKPEFKNGKFTKKSDATTYYTEVLKQVVELMQKGDIAVQCSVNSRVIH